MSGSFAIIPAAAANRGLTAYEWAVLHAIALHADKDGCAYPSLTTIAKVAGVLRPNVARSIKRLERLGLLERKAERPPDARWTNTRYRIPRNSISSDTIQTENGVSSETIQPPNGICGDTIPDANGISGDTINSISRDTLTDQETDSLPLRRISIGEEKVERVNDAANGLSGETIQNTGVGDAKTIARCGFYVTDAIGHHLCGRPTVAGTNRCAEHHIRC